MKEDGRKLSKEQQVKFYEEEIKKILSDYKAYLDSKCIDLINKVELYIGTFEYTDELRNQVVFSFPKDKLPKTKIPLTATKPKSVDVIENLKNTYKELAKKGEIRSAGIVIDSKVQMPDGKKQDAFIIDLQHLDGYAVKVVFPYDKKLFKGYLWHNIFAMIGYNDIFLD